MATHYPVFRLIKSTQTFSN